MDQKAAATFLVFHSPAQTGGNKENVDPQTGAISPSSHVSKGEKAEKPRRALRDITSFSTVASGIFPASGSSKWEALDEDIEVCILVGFVCVFV